MPRLIETKSTKKSDRNQTLSYDVRASERAIDRIDKQTAENRKNFIVKTFSEYFGEQIAANPHAFANRFRKMAESAFKFYRGSAILFYQDVKIDQDPFIARNPSAGHIFIHVNRFQIRKPSIKYSNSRVIYTLRTLALC